jgi:hypothetical protein
MKCEPAMMLNMKSTESFRKSSRDSVETYQKKLKNNSLEPDS